VRKSRTPGSVRGYPVTGIPTATLRIMDKDQGHFQSEPKRVEV
jgi:hypothetical protein